MVKIDHVEDRHHLLLKHAFSSCVSYFFVELCDVILKVNLCKDSQYHSLTFPFAMR